MYYSLNSSVYLSLGGALAAFGLIFAVFQLRRPEWTLILRIRGKFYENIHWVFAAIALLLTLARVLIAEIDLYLLFLPDAPLFYEISAYLFFILSPFSLIYFSANPKGLFNKKNARRFYESLVWEVAKNSDESAHTTLSVLLPNFENICKAIQKHNSEEEIYQSAVAILDVVLSETETVKTLTTKHLGALQYIFTMVEKYNISESDVRIGVSILLKNLFYDKDSFFYKHLHREGLALPLNIYETIFNSPTLLTNFNNFGFLVLEYSKRQEISIRVFTEALSISIKTYLKSGNVPPRHINDGLEHLSEIFGEISLKIHTEEKRGTDTSYVLRPEWDTLHDIARFLGHDYIFIACQEQLDQIVVEREKNTSEASFSSNSTINAGVANTLYKAFEHLSYIDDNDYLYRNILCDLIYGMVYEDSYKEGYREPFLKRMWQQIGANVINRHYPVATRPYLAFIGFYLPDTKESKAKGWLGDEIERVRRLLYIDMKPLLDAETEMINGEMMENVLLPASMDYHDGKFIYRYGFVKGKEREIPSPSEDATSALEEVDLEHKSFL